MTGSNRSKQQAEIFAQVKQILVNLLKVMREKDPSKRPEMKWETDLIEDLGVDSLETIDVMNALEEEFEVSPNLNEVNTKTKIGQIVDYVIELKEREGAKV